MSKSVKQAKRNDRINKALWHSKKRRYGYGCAGHGYEAGDLKAQSRLNDCNQNAVWLWT